MPFGTYSSPEVAYVSATKLMQAGAQIVKMEGGHWLAPIVEHLATRGVPTFVHLGLTPQFVHKLGGFKVQGKSPEAAQTLINDAKHLEAAGASLILLEAIPAVLGAKVTGEVQTPTIGIGAGPSCSGQILVMHDMLGVYPGKKARFVRNFMDSAPSIESAFLQYVASVKANAFPEEQHCFGEKG
jgi:3-methyl-2-oxobutanoate hydroxymethyltransferase